MAAVIRGELFEHGRRDLTGCRFDPGGSGRLFFNTFDVWLHSPSAIDSEQKKNGKQQQ